MLYMVIERFKGGNPDSVGKRFREMGRLMPDSLKYVSSWIEPSGERCFQLMEADSLEQFDSWTCNWSDLVEFEILPVQPSADFWSSR
jgi:hypothetical protein